MAHSLSNPVVYLCEGMKGTKNTQGMNSVGMCVCVCVCVQLQVLNVAG